VNGYLELLPRGMFTPHVGAGIGFVYNQITRSYVNTETLVDGSGTTLSTRSRLGAGKDNDVGLALARMAGFSFSLDNRWALDVGYRALFMDGMSSTIDTYSFVSSTTQHSQRRHAWRDVGAPGADRCAPQHLVTLSLCAREHQQAQARVRGSKSALLWDRLCLTRL